MASEAAVVGSTGSEHGVGGGAEQQLEKAAVMQVVQCCKSGMAAECEQELSQALPRPGQRQVLIKITAVAANPVDMKLQRGDFGDVSGTVLGHDAAGTVLALGAGVTRKGLAVGSRVAVFVEGVGKWASNGAYAQYVAAHECMVVAIPDSLSDEQAAAVPLVGLTAYECVVAHANIRPGQSVLVTGASGGVGNFVVQLCQDAVGASGNVIVTAGGAASIAHVKAELGVDDAHIVSYRGKSVADMAEEVKAANGGKKVDAAFDMFGGDMKRLCFQVAAMGGHVVTIVEEPGADWADDAMALWNGRKSAAFAANLGVHFEFLGGRALFGEESDLEVYASELDALFAKLADGAIKPPKVTSLGTLSAAVVHDMHTQLEKAVVKGKLTAVVAHSA